MLQAFPLEDYLDDHSDIRYELLADDKFGVMELCYSVCIFLPP